MPEIGRFAAAWIGVLGPPIIWLFQFEINYALVPFACANALRWPIYMVTLIALALAAGCGLMSWRTRAANDAPEYIRFMGLGGAVLATGFSLVIIAQGIAGIVLEPCQ